MQTRRRARVDAPRDSHHLSAGDGSVLPFLKPLHSLTKPELQRLCRLLGLIDTGTRDLLRPRIQAYMDENSDVMRVDPVFLALFRGRRAAPPSPQLSSPRRTSPASVHDSPDGSSHVNRFTSPRINRSASPTSRRRSSASPIHSVHPASPFRTDRFASPTGSALRVDNILPLIPSVDDLSRRAADHFARSGSSARRAYMEQLSALNQKFLAGGPLNTATDVPLSGALPFYVLGHAFARYTLVLSHVGGALLFRYWSGFCYVGGALLFRTRLFVVSCAALCGRCPFFLFVSHPGGARCCFLLPGGAHLIRICFCFRAVPI